MAVSHCDSVYGVYGWRALCCCYCVVCVRVRVCAGDADAEWDYMSYIPYAAKLINMGSYETTGEAWFVSRLAQPSCTLLAPGRHAPPALCVVARVFQGCVTHVCIVVYRRVIVVCACVQGC